MGTVMRAEHSVDPDQFEPGIPDDGQARNHVLDFVMIDWNVEAGLGVAPWLGVDVQLPVRLIRVDATFEDASGNSLVGFSSIHHRGETIFGLGDLSLVARFQVVQPSTKGGWTLDLRGGLTFPTGRIQANPFELGRRGETHQHMFFGTGTFDPIAGIETSYAFERFRLVGWSSVRSALYENVHGYQGATQVTGGLGMETSFGLEEWRFLAQPEVYFETSARWSGEAAQNSGRLDMTATLGVFWMPHEEWTANLRIKLPWTIMAEGGQLRVPFVAILGVSYALDLWDAAG